MARELGLNPRKLGKIDNHKQEPWKLPLPQFIEKIYRKRFGKAAPDKVLTIEQWAAHREAKKAAKKKEARPDSQGAGTPSGEETQKPAGSPPPGAPSSGEEMG